jgi:hypothetical protein
VTSKRHQQQDGHKKHYKVDAQLVQMRGRRVGGMRGRAYGGGMRFMERAAGPTAPTTPTAPVPVRPSEGFPGFFGGPYRMGPGPSPLDRRPYFPGGMFALPTSAFPLPSYEMMIPYSGSGLPLIPPIGPVQTFGGYRY